MASPQCRNPEQELKPGRQAAFHQLKTRSRSRKLLLDGLEVIDMHGLRCFEHLPASDERSLCSCPSRSQFCNDFLPTLYVPFP